MTIPIWLVILLLCAISFGTRLLPFIVGKRLLRYAWLGPLRTYLPTVIIFIVLVYELMGFPWRHYPYGLPALIAISAVILVHRRWHQEILSIATGVISFGLLNFFLVH